MYINEQKQIHTQDINSKDIDKKLLNKIAKKYQSFIIMLDVERDANENNYQAILTDDKFISGYGWKDFYYNLVEYIKDGSEF
jgi:hypothetical protein